MFLCFAHLDLVSVGFTGARGTANNSSTTHGCLARGFNCPGSRSVVLGDTDTDSFT
jgi:hypothetical protein